MQSGDIFLTFRYRSPLRTNRYALVNEELIFVPFHARVGMSLNDDVRLPSYCRCPSSKCARIQISEGGKASSIGDSKCRVPLIPPHSTCGNFERVFSHRQYNLHRCHRQYFQSSAVLHESTCFRCRILTEG